jgi:hypothetical protein
MAIGTDSVSESGDCGCLGELAWIEDAVTREGGKKVDDRWLEAAEVFNTESIFYVRECRAGRVGEAWHGGKKEQKNSERVMSSLGEVVAG